MGQTSDRSMNLLPLLRKKKKLDPSSIETKGVLDWVSAPNAS